MKTTAWQLERIHTSRKLRQQHGEDAQLQALVHKIQQQYPGGVAAILVYGSWLRGKRDTMLDFYVLLDNYQSLESFWQRSMCRLLPPNVYQIQVQVNDKTSRAKYALLSIDRFEYAMGHDFHSYFWARFAQPCEVIHAHNETVIKRLATSFSTAAAHFIQQATPLLKSEFSSQQLWVTGLQQTYRCELRTESGQRAEDLYQFNPDYYQQLTHLLCADQAVALQELGENTYRNTSSSTARKFATLKWMLRRLQGKILSLLRLLKAAFTFNQALPYLLWKIERHSGVYIEPTERQLKHPLIFAWPLLWRLYRQGAFR